MKFYKRVENFGLIIFLYCHRVKKRYHWNLEDYNLLIKNQLFNEQILTRSDCAASRSDRSSLST